MIILDYFLLNEPQFSTALFTGLFLFLSMVVGRALRRNWVEGGAWGFLILAGSADLSIFISRALELPTDGFGPLVVGLCAVIIFVLRFLCFPSQAQSQPSNHVYVIVLVTFVIVIWAGNILHPLPDSGFSSHHGVIPLYIQESFSLGRFIFIEDTVFGEGLMTSLFYPADLLGLVALAGWLGAGEVYPAFNAGSIAATMLMFALLASSFRDSKGALIAFFVLAMIMFAFDPFYRTVLGGNWGDVIMYLGGALICFYLSQGDQSARPLFLAATASLFLVFSRHYGAFYSALIISFCFLMSWTVLKERRFSPWLAVGSFWMIFSIRELYYLFGRFTKYYPGSWQAERREFSFEELFSGTLTDWGLINASDMSLEGISIRALYVVILLFISWKLWPEAKRDKPRFVAIYAPLIILAAPLTLQLLTGYRTNAAYSKIYIISIFFFAWYPVFLLTQLGISGSVISVGSRFRSPIILATITGGLIISWIVFEKVNPSRFIESNLENTLQNLFEDKIPDREIVHTLRRELTGDQMQDVINRPVMYVYFEPGTSLRLYLGGEFLNDLDFWSAPVKEKMKSAKSMEELLQQLNYPNVYIGLMPKGKVPDFGDPERKTLISEIENYKNAAWVDKIVEYGNAKFFIVRKPASN